METSYYEVGSHHYERKSVIEHMQELTGRQLDNDVIEMVLSECNWKVDDSVIEKLLELLSGTESGEDAKTEFSLKSIAGMLCRQPELRDGIDCDNSGSADAVPDISVDQDEWHIQDEHACTAVNALPVDHSAATPGSTALLRSGVHRDSTTSADLLCSTSTDYSNITADSSVCCCVDGCAQRSSPYVESLSNTLLPSYLPAAPYFCVPTVPVWTSSLPRRRSVEHVYTVAGQQTVKPSHSSQGISPTHSLAAGENVAPVSSHNIVQTSGCSSSNLSHVLSASALPFIPSATASQPAPSGEMLPRGDWHQSSGKTLTTTAEAVHRVFELLAAGYRVMVLMRGCPGSGKTTAAMQIVFDGVILSTDDFFVDVNGIYHYNSQYLQQAHAWNQQRAQQAMLNGWNPVIIDNTNVHAWHMLPYVSLACKYGYTLEICEPNTPWRLKASQLAKRNVHGVDSRQIKCILEKYEHNITPQKLMAMLPSSGQSAVHGKHRPWTTVWNSQNATGNTQAAAWNSPTTARNVSESSAIGVFSRCRSEAATSATANSASSSSASGLIRTSNIDSSVADTGSSSDSVVPGPNNILHPQLPVITCRHWTAPMSVSELLCCETMSSTTVLTVSSVVSRTSKVTQPSDDVLPLATVSVICGRDALISQEYSSSPSKYVTPSYLLPASGSAVTEDVNGTDKNLVAGPAAGDSRAPRSGKLCTEIVHNSEISQNLLEPVFGLPADHRVVAERVNCPASDIESISYHSPESEIVTDISLSQDVDMQQLSDIVTASVDQPVCHYSQSSAMVSASASCLQTTDSATDMHSDHASEENRKTRDAGAKFCEWLVVDFVEKALKLCESTVCEVEPCKSDVLATENCQADVGRLNTAAGPAQDAESGSHCTEYTASVASVSSDVTIPGLTLHHSIMSGSHKTECAASVEGTVELNCCSIESSVSVDNHLLPKSIAEHIPTGINLPSEVENLESPVSEINEVKIENSRVNWSGASRASELMYWGQMDSNNVLCTQNDELKLCPEAANTVSCGTTQPESILQDPVAWKTESKPQRTRCRGSQKANISSLSESINAGKEWVTEYMQGQEFCMQLRENDFCKNSSVYIGATDNGGDDSTNPSNVESHNDPVECQSASTQTEPHDFVVLMKATECIDVTWTADYVAVMSTLPRAISSSACDNHDSPKIPVKLMLDKSCSTADETEEVDSSSQLDFLASCFPAVGRRDLQELLTNCRSDIIVAADLLAEFGYEYNEPQDDVSGTRVSSSSATESTGYSREGSPVVRNSSPHTEDRSRRNQSPMYRLGRSSLIPKAILPESRIIRARDKLRPAINPPPSGGAYVSENCDFPSITAAVSSSLPSMVESKPLTLTLTAVMASQLVQLFGPSGSDDDLTVELDEETASRLHRCWQATQQRRASSPAVSQLSREGASAAAAGGSRVSAVSSVWVDHLESPGRHADKLLEDNAAQLLATKIKRQHLRDRFPNINSTVLDEIFRDNGYSLERTMKHILENSELVTPAVNVMTTDAALEYEIRLLNQAIEDSLQDQMQSKILEASPQCSLPDVDTAYKDTLSQVIHHHRRHKECLSQAAEAHRKGTWGAALHYSDQARRHKKRHDEAKLCAAELFVQQRLTAGDDGQSTLDLHGLSTAEALHVLRSTLSKHEAEMNVKSSAQSCDAELTVVTGRGRHSHNGVARLRPAVIGFLNSNNYQ